MMQSRSTGLQSISIGDSSVHERSIQVECTAAENLGITYMSVTKDISSKRNVSVVKPNIKIFLSHSDKDKKIASELKLRLSKHGLSIFLAHEDIDMGSDWVSKLYEEIQSSKIFIMLLTKNYYFSSYTDQETGIAINYKKTILPICIDDTRPYGFAAAKQAKICSLPFNDSTIEEIARFCKIELLSKNISELDRLIAKLERSHSYTESAKICSRLQEYDDFSESQIQRIAFSGINNPQVYYSYVADSIINEIIGDNLDKVSPSLRFVLEGFHDPSHPSLN